MQRATAKTIQQILQKKVTSALDRLAPLRSWVNLLVDALSPSTMDKDFQLLRRFMRSFAISQIRFHDAKVNEPVKILLIVVVN